MSWLIYVVEADADTKTTDINTALGYPLSTDTHVHKGHAVHMPEVDCITTHYSRYFENTDGGQWAFWVDDTVYALLSAPEQALVVSDLPVGFFHQ